MPIKVDAKGISAFTFQVIFFSLLIFQVEHLRLLEEDPATKWYVYAGLGIMALVVVFGQALSARIPPALQQVAGMGVFLFQWFAWEEMPVFAVAYLACFGIFLVPYLSKYFLPHRIAENPSGEQADRSKLLPYFGIAIGVLLGRYLLLLSVMDLAGVYVACLLIGTITALVEMLWQFRNKVQGRGGTGKDHHSMHAGVVFAMAFLLMEAHVLARYSPTLPFWPIETYIEIRLGAIAITTVAHLFTDGRKLFAPAVFLGSAAVLLAWGNIAIVLAIFNLLFEVLLINMLFTIPFLPIRQDHSSSRRLRLLNLGFWLIALGIFVGGQFIFFHVEDLYQFLSFFIGGGIVFASWIKPALIQRRGKRTGGNPQ